MRETLICIRCRQGLSRSPSALICSGCGVSYPIHDGIPDFSEGEYYDTFDPQRHELSPEHRRGLELEVEGSERRIRDFYAPLIRKAAPEASRILDCGCGNGVSVDVLSREGFEAWGNDLSELRRWQWRERESSGRLVVASGLRLPFPDGFFDVLVCSGVLEHIGVLETPAPTYSVAAASDQRRQRIAFLRELARVVSPGGYLFLDFPNGAFPVDFWHGNSPGSPRVHSPREPFLPTFDEVKELGAEALPTGATLRALSPRGRLQFRQSAEHLHGRLLSVPAALFFHVMSFRPFTWLARTPLNPFLVLQITLPRSRAGGRYP